MGDRGDEIDRDWQRDKAEDELARLRAVEAAARELLRARRSDGSYLTKSSFEVAEEKLRLALGSLREGG